MKPKDESVMRAYSAAERAERLLVQLAGCDVAAMGCATGENDCKKGDYGWSPAFQAVKDLRKERDDLAQALKAKMSASEAIYGFAAWLTTRDKSITMSGEHDTPPVLDLVIKFCAVNHLEDPRADWDNKLTHPID